jgi:hypothetical protein
MKIVWLLGAGASAESSYPLVNDFLTRKYVPRLTQLYSLVGTRDVVDQAFGPKGHYLVSVAKLAFFPARQSVSDDSSGGTRVPQACAGAPAPPGAFRDRNYLAEHTADINAVTSDCIRHGDLETLRRIHTHVVT